MLLNNFLAFVCVFVWSLGGHASCLVSDTDQNCDTEIKRLNQMLRKHPKEFRSVFSKTYGLPKTKEIFELVAQQAQSPQSPYGALAASLFGYLLREGCDQWPAATSGFICEYAAAAKDYDLCCELTRVEGIARESRVKAFDTVYGAFEENPDAEKTMCLRLMIRKNFPDRESYGKFFGSLRTILLQPQVPVTRKRSLHNYYLRQLIGAVDFTHYAGLDPDGFIRYLPMFLSYGAGLDYARLHDMKLLAGVIKVSCDVQDSKISVQDLELYFYKACAIFKAAMDPGNAAAEKTDDADARHDADLLMQTVVDRLHRDGESDMLFRLCVSIISDVRLPMEIRQKYTFLTTKNINLSDDSLQ